MNANPYPARQARFKRSANNSFTSAAAVWLMGVLWTTHAQAQTVDSAFYDNRYIIFTANNYGLRKGEAYYQNSMLLFNQAYFGFSDGFSCGFGIVPHLCLGAERRRYGSIPDSASPSVPKDLPWAAGLSSAVFGAKTYPD